MKRKILLFSMLLISVLFVGIGKVNAEEYKAGDLVEVINPSGGKSQQFYVVAGKNEIIKMRENYCKSSNRQDEEICNNINVSVDESYNYGNYFGLNDSDIVILVSKDPVYKQATFSYDMSNEDMDFLIDQLYPFDKADFTYIYNIIMNDSYLYNLNDVSHSFGFYLELLYSKNDNMTYSNSEEYEKSIYNVPNYLKNYVGSYCNFIKVYVAVTPSIYYFRYAKIDSFSNNTISLSAGKISNNLNSSVTADSYATLIMRKSDLKLIKSSEIKKEETSKQEITNQKKDLNEESISNPKTSDINIVIIGMVTLIVLSGVIVGIRRLKKLSK